MLNKKQDNKEFIYGIRVDAQTRERMRLTEDRVNWPQVCRDAIKTKLKQLTQRK